MGEWTSMVGAPHLARLLTSQRFDAQSALPAGRRLPAYRALAEGMRLLVSEGRVPVAARVPAERELASALAVSRTTVAAAYQALRNEGFLVSRRGSGSWTAVPAGRSVPTRGLDPLPPATGTSMIDLGCASLPAPEPWLTRAVRQAAEELPRYAATHGDYADGLPVLRRLLAERYTARGVPTRPEQIMITTGAMGAVGALCRALFHTGERVAVEAPSYANVLELIRSCGGRLVPVPMADASAGWDLPAWRQVLREAAPRMAYVMGDFHNPTGALASAEQRRELVAAARSAGTVLVVDETMAELCLEPDVEMPPPVAAFAQSGDSVISIGSTSKAFWVGLRIGWVRAAPEMIRSLVAARAYSDLASPVVEQLAVAWLMEGEGWGEATGLRRAEGRANRDDLVAALRRHLPEWEFDVPTGGLTLWARTAGLSGSRVAELGERQGVRVPAGTRFGVDGAFESYVRLPFTVGGALADDAASRLAATTRLLTGGYHADAVSPTPVVA